MSAIRLKRRRRKEQIRSNQILPGVEPKKVEQGTITLMEFTKVKVSSSE